MPKDCQQKIMGFTMCFAIIFINFVIPHVVADACSELATCTEDMQHGTNGTFSHTLLTSRPSTEEAWTTIHENICSTREERKQCTTSSPCTNQTVLSSFKKAKKLAEGMCQDNKNFYERIYDEESSCLGNITKVKQASDNRKKCKSDYSNTITDTTSATETCRLVNETRNCDRNYVGNMCGDLHRWMIDMAWNVTIQVDYPSCVQTLSPYFAFPAETE